MTRTRGTAGFTLIELLAAMAIFAVLAVMVQQALIVSLTTESRLADRRGQLAALQRGVMLIARDLQNIAPRAVRDSAGNFEPVLALDESGEGLTLTRGGVPTPALLPRSGFQRIRYTIADDGRGVERRVWGRLDPAPGAEPRVDRVLEDARSVRFRVWAPASGWQTVWPDPDVPATRSRLPDGIELVLETERWGQLRRVVSLR